MLAVLSAAAWLLLWAATATADQNEKTVLHIMVGAVFSLASGVVLRWIYKGEARFQGALPARARAIEEILSHAGFCVTSVVLTWDREIDKPFETLSLFAQDSRLLLGGAGVRSVERFATAMLDLRRKVFSSRDEAMKAAEPQLEILTKDLLALVGESPDSVRPRRRDG